MSNKKAIFLSLSVLFFLLLGQFIYYNVVVPWPYRHELKACLEKARFMENQLKIEKAENICFRTYPHFL